MKKLSAITLILLMAALFAACSPQVGSEAWCDKMADKPKGDWTTNEATQFAKHCVFGNYKKD